MASGYQAATDGDSGRSGGKILKRRGTAARRTPYDRPTTPPQPESPNWFNGLVFPAKFVAGGASKLFSSFWNPKSWGSRSSSSNNGSDSDVSEDNEDLPDGTVELNQKKGSSSGKSEILHLVEQLLMLEQYSREECDKIIEIINSRVVDDNTMEEETDAGPSNITNIADVETSDIRNQAVMEAKKLITKSMVGSSSKSDLDNGMHGSKSVMTPHITKGEGRSPVDVAKSYMQTRPPWVSPIRHSDPPTPLPLAADLSKEGPPYSSVGGNSFSSAKKDHLSAGSWNIQDEIRMLRNKATEDMLSNHRSSKIPESATEHEALANDKAVEVMEVNEPITLEAPKLQDEALNPASEEGTQGLSNIRTTQDNAPTEALPTIDEQNQMAEEQDTTSNKSHNTINPDNEQNPRHSSEEKEVDIGHSDERPKTENVNRTEPKSTKVGTANGSVGNNNNKAKSSKKADSPNVRRVATRSSRYGRRDKSRAK